MKAIILFLVVLFVAAPAKAQSAFVYKSDPFESCTSISNNEPVRLTVYKCRGEPGPDRVSVLTTFRLGNSSLAPTRFLLRGGIELEMLDRPYATLTTCSGYGACNYISTVTFYVPFSVLFSEDAVKTGVQIKVSGMMHEEFIIISPREIADLRAALITHGFIEN